MDIKTKNCNFAAYSSGEDPDRVIFYQPDPTPN